MVQLLGIELFLHLFPIVKKLLNYPTIKNLWINIEQHFLESLNKRKILFGLKIFFK